MPTTTYLITGANRGIGRALTSSLLLRPQTTVLALVRDPSDETSQSLSTLEKAEGSRVLTTAYDAADTKAAHAAIDELKSSHSISTIDVAIANAGFAGYFGPSTNATAESIMSHFTTNSLAQVLLFQAVLPLLRASSDPKFVGISSQVGSIGSMAAAKRAGALPYGMSKAAVNYAMMSLAIEHPELVIQILTPGRVMTDFGGPDIKKRVPAAVSLEDSIAGLLKLIDSANKETSGKFYNWDGKELPW